MNLNRDSYQRISLALLALLVSVMIPQAQTIEQEEYQAFRRKIEEHEVSPEQILTYLEDAKSGPERRKAGYGYLLNGFHLSYQIDEGAKTYYKETERIAIELSDTLLLADTYIEFAFHLKNVSSKRDSSMLMFGKALILSQEIDYNYGIIQSSYGLAFNLMDLGNYLRAMEYMLDISPNVDSLNAPVQKGRLLNNIGHVYMQLELNEQAIQLFKEFNETVENAKSAQVYRLMGKVNLAEAYLKNNQIDLAFRALSEVEKIGKDGFPEPQKTFYYRILGKASLANHDYPDAIKYFNQSNDVKNNNRVNKIINNVGISKAYLGLGDTLISHQVLVRAKRISEELELFPLRESVDLFQSLASSYEFLGNATKALEYSKMHLEAYKRLHNERLVSDFFLKEIGERLERQRKQAEIERQVFDQHLEEEKLRNYVLILISVLIAISLILLILRYRDKVKHTKDLVRINSQIIEQKADIEEKAHILRETNEKISFLNKDLEGQVEKSVSELSAKEHIINTYSHMNSHTLRSPVASIIGLSSLFEVANDEEKKEIMQLILMEAKRLDGIVHDIQDSLTSKEKSIQESEN